MGYHIEFLSHVSTKAYKDDDAEEASTRLVYMLSSDEYDGMENHYVYLMSQPEHAEMMKRRSIGQDRLHVGSNVMGIPLHHLLSILSHLPTQARQGSPIDSF